MRKSSGRLRGLAIAAEGKNVVGHAGGVHLQLLADKVGLIDELDHAMRRKGFRPLHPRGRC